MEPYEILNLFEDSQSGPDAQTMSVSMSELLTPDFLASCSKFRSLDELFQASGYRVKSSEDFKAIPDAPWDNFIASRTTFRNWREMLQAAGAVWARTKLR